MATTTRQTTPESAPAPEACPICHRGAVRINHDPRVFGVATLLDATCLNCGWHFTTAARRLELDALHTQADEMLDEIARIKR